MARISQYDQDSTLNKADKVIGTDSATGATKNYSIESILSVANEANLVESFDGAAFEFKDYVDPAGDVDGIINLNAGSATDAAFSSINVIYISVNDKSGNSLREYLENADNDFIKISKTDNLNQFGIYEITNIEDYGSNKYKKLTVAPRGTNGTLTVGVKYFVANYSALYDQDFSDDSVTEFQDVTSAGSGKIITDDERTQLQSLNANALVHNDVVDNVTSTSTNLPLSANQGKVLKGLIDNINTLLQSDETSLDTLQEVVDYIETNRNTLDSLGISNITGLQAALNAKQNAESGKGLSEEDFTSALKSRLENIEAGAEVNVKPNWTAAAGTDAEILNKPSDLTVLSSHNVAELSDITSAGSGAIITDAERNKIDSDHATFIGLSQAERNKLTGLDVNATTRVVTDGTDSITVPPQNAEQNVQVNWDEDNSSSDAFILNKPDVTLKADKNTTITIQGTTDEVEVSPDTAQDLSANRTVTIGLPNDVTIGNDLTVTDALSVGESIEITETLSTAPSFDNGLYFSTEDTHDTLHFRYHGHDLSIDHLTQNIPTGILDGGVLAKVDATTFSITAGKGVINILNKDNSDPHPEIKEVSWSAQSSISHTEGDVNNADQLNTWVYINSSGTIVQTTTFPGPSVWRDNIVIGSVIHSSNVIRFTKTFPRPSYSNGNTYAEFAEIFGPLKKSGHLLTVNSTNTLRLDRAAGVSFALGRNYETDAENPSIVDDAASTPVFHRYSSTSTGFTKDDGTNGAGYTDLDPTKYDNNGTLTSMNTAKFSVQRLYHFPNNTNVIVAYYGKAEYQSIDEAEKNYLLEDFQEADNTAGQAIYLGAIVVKGNATDLGDSGQAKILTAGIFRSLAATNLGGVAADSALNDLTDVSISSVQNDQVLKYNSSSGQWENQAEGGSIDGTGAANKLAIWSDTDTLTNDIALHWNSNNDRLGIGEAAPDKRLHLTGNSDSNASFKIERTDTSSVQILGYDYLGTFSNNNLRFFTNSTERFKIHNSGLAHFFGGTGELIRLQDSSNSGNPFLTFYQGNTRRSLIQHVDGNDTLSLVSEYGDIRFSTGTGGTEVERVRIDSSGNVGINTNSPASSLDIATTDAIIVPKGTNAERDALTPESGMFRFNTTDNEFEGYDGTEWGAIGGSTGGGSGEIVKKTFSGGGSSYTLDDTIADIDNVQVFVDGVYQYPSNYTVSGSTVNFVSGSTPASGTDNVHIVHNVAVPTLTEGAAMSTSVSLTGDGTTTSFALGGSPRSSEHMMVFLNGVYQEKSTYSLSGSNVVFDDAPPNGYSIEVKYITGTLDLTDVGEIVLAELTGDGTATYALGVTPTHKKHTNVYIEGVYQEKSTYSVSGSNIIFDTNVPTGYSIEVSTLKMTPASSVEPTTFEVDTFTGDGSTNNFTLVNGSPSSKSLTMVFIQGVYQAKSKYNLVSGQIQFTGGTPADDDAIEVISISAVNTSVNAVTSVNGEVGEVTVQTTPDVQVISADTNAVKNTLYVFTATLTLTLPASPDLGDSIKISNLSDVATCVLGRNGNKIMGVAEDLTLDTASASFELIWSGDTKGWVIIGQ